MTFALLLRFMLLKVLPAGRGWGQMIMCLFPPASGPSGSCLGQLITQASF